MTRRLAVLLATTMLVVAVPTGVSAAPAAAPAAVAAPRTGLTARYFAPSNLTTPKLTRVEPRVDRTWGTAAPHASLPRDGFVVRWTGRLQAPRTGTYAFDVRADDAVRLWVNGKRLVDRWSAAGVRVSRGSIALRAGQWYALRMDYQDRSGSATAQLRWTGPGIAKQLLPQALLRPSASAVASSTPPPAPRPSPSPSTPKPPVPEAPAPGTTSGQLWSNPATWGGAGPTAGASVTVPAGKTVVLDVNPPALSYLQVDGTLIFARKDLTLRADAVMVHGTLQIGTATAPFTQRARIVLTGADRSANVMGMGAKVLGVMGGTLDLHGDGRRSWTRLTATAAKGATTIAVASATGWRVGNRISLASTDFSAKQAEERTITAVTATTLTLDAPLAHPHWGTTQLVDGRAVDERGEVALLSRTITIEGDSATSADGFGGQVMVMPGSTARIKSVELRAMGQLGVLRRYPIHFHMVADAAGSYVTDSAIHHSFNRCVTIHGTHNLTVARNVCADTVGHGFFFEDGAETGNVLDGNLAMTIRKPPAGKELLASDRSPAAYWITNPANTIRDNVAAGSAGFGFWVALPQHPTGLSTTTSVWPLRTPLGVFAGNVAHSNDRNGLHVDDGPNPDGTTDDRPYRPVTNPADPKSAPVVATFATMRAYKNRDHGVWLRGDHHRLERAVLADNGIGVTFASTESFLVDSLVVGETANVGSPESWEATGPGGRSLPKPWAKNFPIRGFQFYDGRVGAIGTTFANFTPVEGLRKASGVGFLLKNAFPVHPRNYAEALRFVNAVPVWAETPVAGMDGDVSGAFLDADGSVTGTAGRYVTAAAPFLQNDGSCVRRADWNASVCNASYVSLRVSSLDGNPAATHPLRIRRTDGVTQTLMGTSASDTAGITLAQPNARYDVDFTDVNGAVTPARSRYVLWRGAGTWMRLTVDYPTLPKVTKYGCDLDNAASWCPGAKTSLSALDSSTGSAYWYDATAKKLHLKLVAGTSEWEALEVGPR